ncbi:MAG: carbamoyl-phosphate synthase small subunit [Patescibacteria group bacterium]
MKSKLILEDGSQFEGASFGAPTSTAGEVVFSTGMVGYPESLTDPSYLGQILILTYPLIGSYGVPDRKYWESDGIKISGLIVSNYIDTPSHIQSKQTLGAWLKSEQIPALEIPDTRFSTQKIRTKGTMLGKIVFNDKDVKFHDPNKENLVAKVSTKKIIKEGTGKKTVLLFDCGAKGNIAKCLAKRGVRVVTVPWDFDPFDKDVHLGGVEVAASPPSEVKRRAATSEVVLRLRHTSEVKFDAIVISNGPGDPKMADKTIQTIKKALTKKIPILGVCLGHQLLALAAGGDTKKLEFGHRSQNQPCLLEDSERPARHASRALRGITDRCYITTQNHGFEVYKIPNDFKPWFTNTNDGSNEGIIHNKFPIMSVQFHPEANPGPNDTEWIFDYFLEHTLSS